MLPRTQKFVLLVAVLATSQAPACNGQFFYPHNAPPRGSLSSARSTASENQLNFGGLGLSHGRANAQTITETNGGHASGGSTAISNSRSTSGGINLGGLGIGSTLTSSQTRTNGAASGALSHDLNVGGLGIGTSLSPDNLRNGLGLKRSQEGGLQLGLGLLNFDLSRRPQQHQSQAHTHAQAEAQGLDAFAKANSNAATRSRQLGLFGLTNTQSHANAISGSRYGQTTASAGGKTGNRNYYKMPQGIFLRSKRAAQFAPFAYPGTGFQRPRRQFGRPFGRQRPGAGYAPPNFGYGYPLSQNANAQGLANNRDEYFEQQAGANTQTRQELNENGFFQNNGASSIGSNLATDGSSGHLSSANVNQDYFLTNHGLHNANNAQSQALHFDRYQQQAANSNAGTKEIQTAQGGRLEAFGGSQATNNHPYGTSSNIANTNSAVYQEGDVHGSQADASSQSIFQGNDGQNSAAGANSGVSSVQGPDGFIRHSANSNASAVSRGGQSANAAASASAHSNGDGGGGGDALANANSIAGDFDGYGNLGGAEANSAVFSFTEFQG